MFVVFLAYVLISFLDLILFPGSECNSSLLTFDGVDLMGERLAEEVISVKGHFCNLNFIWYRLSGVTIKVLIRSTNFYTHYLVFVYVDWGMQ